MSYTVLNTDALRKADTRTYEDIAAAGLDTPELMALAMYGSEEFAYLVQTHNLVKDGGSTNKKVIVPTIPPPTFAMPTNDPEVDAQIKRLAKYKDEDLTVLVFHRKKEFRDRPWKLTGLTDVTVRASLFEGSRALSISWPAGMNDDPGLNLYGNHIVVGVRGEAIFTGLMIEVKVAAKKGVVRTWTAQSHSFVALNTHFNPQDAATGFDKMTPLDIIQYVSGRYDLPIAMDSTAEQLLEVPYVDQDGLTNINSDIMGTTPFKLIHKLVSATGLYVHAREDGVLAISKVNVQEGYSGLLEDNKETVFDVKLNYGNLARTYCVMSQKRESDDVAIADFEEFPLPIFKNVARDTGLGAALDMANAWGGSGVAVHEMSKDLAGSVNIDVTVPGWIDPNTGYPWHLPTRTRVFAPNYGLAGGSQSDEPIDVVVSETVFTWSGKEQITKLSLSLPGVFDVTLNLFLPFLTEWGEPLTFTVVKKSQLGDTEGEE